MRLTGVPVGATELPQTAQKRDRRLARTARSRSRDRRLARTARSRSDGVRGLDEVVLEAETLREQLPEPADAERLGGVVAGRDEVRAALASVGHDVLGGLPGEERVEAAGDHLGEVRRRAARHDADAVDQLRARVPDERLLAEEGGAAVA